MSTDPDQIRREIEQTRSSLSGDVDALAYKASPRRMVNDRTRRVGDAFRNVRDSVMGSATDVADRGGSATSAVGDKVSSVASTVSEHTSSAASTVADTMRDAPAALRRKTQGNPLAAGVVVFGLGWLVSSLLPASEREQRAAGAVKHKVADHADTLKAEAKDLVDEAKANLEGPAHEAVDSVRSTAQDAAATVKDEGRSAASDVKVRTDEARDEIRR
jgi:gas vesicle protein